MADEKPEDDLELQEQPAEGEAAKESAAPDISWLTDAIPAQPVAPKPEAAVQQEAPQPLDMVRNEVETYTAPVPEQQAPVDAKLPQRDEPATITESVNPTLVQQPVQQPLLSPEPLHADPNFADVPRMPPYQAVQSPAAPRTPAPRITESVNPTLPAPEQPAAIQRHVAPEQPAIPDAPPAAPLPTPEQLPRVEPPISDTPPARDGSMAPPIADSTGNKDSGETLKAISQTLDQMRADSAVMVTLLDEIRTGIENLNVGLG